VDKATTTGNDNYCIEIYNRRFLFGFYNSQWREFLSPNTLAMQRWYYVAATWDGASRTVRLYEDGVLVSTQTATRDLRTNTQGCEIGYSPYGEYWSGRLRDVRIYNRTLSTAEILQIKNGTL
jgi:hypothetical protein